MLSDLEIEDVEGMSDIEVLRLMDELDVELRHNLYSPVRRLQGSAGLAQTVERLTCNETVEGSIPSFGSNFFSQP